MIRDHPHGTELLTETMRVITEYLLPNLSSDVRYQALMTIRAITLVENELSASADSEIKLGEELRQIVEADGTLSELTRLTAKRIREGEFDGSNEMFAFLQLATAFKLKETNPAIIGKELESKLDQLQV